MWSFILTTRILYFPDNCHEQVKDARTFYEYFCPTNAFAGVRKLLVIILTNCFTSHADGRDNVLFCMECILGWMSNKLAVRI